MVITMVQGNMNAKATTGIAAVARIVTDNNPSRYDNLAIMLHWLTVLFVLAQFGLAELWGFAPHPTRHLMIVAHMSFGILLTLVLSVRIVWRLTPGHQVRGATLGWVELASKTVHYLLYGLLSAEASLGFLLRWSGNEAMSFFGFLIPPPFVPFKAAHHLVIEGHNWIAWTIIILATGHALAALFHHFVLHDDVLWRMLPGRYASHAEIRTPPLAQAGRRWMTTQSGVGTSGKSDSPGTPALTAPVFPARTWGCGSSGTESSIQVAGRRSAHCSSASNAGQSDWPQSVRPYSTLGGT